MRTISAKTLTKQRALFATVPEDRHRLSALDELTLVCLLEAIFVLNPIIPAAEAAAHVAQIFFVKRKLANIRANDDRLCTGALEFDRQDRARPSARLCCTETSTRRRRHCSTRSCESACRVCTLKRRPPFAALIRKTRPPLTQRNVLIVLAERLDRIVGKRRADRLKSPAVLCKKRP